MAKSPQKTPKYLDRLPEGWQSREDLLSILLNNDDVVDTWKNTESRILPNNVDDILRILFMRNSWQLTTWGAAAMMRACCAWKLEHPENLLINGRVLINMGRIIQSPWFNHGRVIYVWDEGVHFEMQMFDGNIHKFIDFRQK